MGKRPRLIRNAGALLKTQWSEVQQGGYSRLSSKLASLITFFPALLGALFIRGIRPLLHIRLCRVRSERIGQFAIDPELYLCRLDQGLLKKPGIDVFYSIGRICNTQVALMWQRVLYYWPLSHLFPVALVKNLVRCLGPAHLFVLDLSIDQQGILASTPTHLSLTAGENLIGWEEVKRFGLSPARPFVIFHARDSSYLAKSLPYTDWSYHEYRDTDVKRYHSSARALSELGIDSVRMGSVAAERLSPSEGGRFVDYPFEGPSDFLDVFLSAKCRFGVFTTAGLWTLPAVFRRPLVTVNWLGPTVLKDQLFIPKRFWLRSEKRFLRFSEIYGRDIFFFGQGKQFRELGIEVVENTSDEIREVVLEMETRLNGSWKTEGEDDELQKRFLARLNPDASKPVISCRIGREFLRQNLELLD